MADLDRTCPGEDGLDDQQVLIASADGPRTIGDVAERSDHRSSGLAGDDNFGTGPCRHTRCRSDSFVSLWTSSRDDFPSACIQGRKVRNHRSRVAAQDRSEWSHLFALLQGDLPLRLGICSFKDEPFPKCATSHAR